MIVTENKDDIGLFLSAGGKEAGSEPEGKKKFS
jgi:hypothetical protein